MSSGSWGQWTQKTQPSPCPVTLCLRDTGGAEALSGADPPLQCRGRAGGRQGASYVTVFAPFSLNDLCCLHWCSQKPVRLDTLARLQQ